MIADALHNTGDVIAVIVTYIALKVGSKKSNFKYTFGFIKAEMMAAFVNTLFLFLTMLYLLYESVGRFFNPEVIEPLYMIVVGLIAFIANGISAYILHSIGVGHHHTHEEHNHHHDANIYSAYLHMLSDALISIAVVIAGIFIYFFKIYYIDSILTILFTIYILKHSYPLLKQSFLSLMDINTTDISKEQIDNIIFDVDNRIVEYHDLHIYTPSSKDQYLSLHLVLSDEDIVLKELETITNTIENKLISAGFNHVLIQVDTLKNIKNSIHCING